MAWTSALKGTKIIKMEKTPRHACLQSKNRRKGQMSLLIVLSLIPLFTLFAFAVNVGMLVNAKISLQNAADLAAYAGAATQARQLTHISHLNYQMRQAYKKFLFRYYVLGNMSLRCFPGVDANHCQQAGGKEAFGAAPFDWKNPGGAYPGMPSVCIAVSAENNVCQLTESGVPVVQPPPCFPTDPICGQLQTTAQQIADLQRRSCKANTVVNQELLTYWLYSTSKTIQLKTQANLNILVQDLGLVPENISHFQRIKTIQEQYINAPPRTSVTAKRLPELENVPDQAVNERAVLAFNTARFNLNENVFNPDDIEMTELLPSGNKQLILTPIQPKFDAMYSIIDADTISSKACRMIVQRLIAKPFLGVYKNPASRVYYAVKITARAKIFFNPFPLGHAAPDIELTAYAAAQPFGSRIGPSLDESQFVREIQGGLQSIRYPILPMSEDGQEYSMESADTLRSLYQVLRTSSPAGNLLTTDAIQRGIQAAMMPDEFELGKYNIPADTELIDAPAGNRFFENAFTAYFRNAGGGFNAEYTFWAPIQSAASGGDLNQIRDEIKQEIESNISLSTTASTSGSRLAAILQSELDTFLHSLKAQNNFNVARMQDPFGQAVFNGNTPNIIKKISDIKRTATSFTSDHDAQIFAHGRDGYSVKFIPLRSLYSETGLGGNTSGAIPFSPLKDGLFGTMPDLTASSH